MSDKYHHGNLKNELIECAIKYISEHGSESLSVRKLSEQCGVSHNAVYRHFESKKKLIDCCRIYVTKKLTAYLSEQIDKLAYTDPETIYKLSHSYIDYFKNNPSYFEFIYQNEACCKINFSLDEVDDNYPPFEIFRKLCLALIEKYNLSREEGLKRLVRYWSLMQGAVSLIISPNVTLDGQWDACLKDIFIIGGNADE